MIWKKDKLKPSQPYFVFDTKDFCQEIYLKQGISHFYTYHTDDDYVLRTVPDGCIDLFFEYNNDGMRGYVCGTRLKYNCQDRNGVNEVFGVRFMPGMQPEFLSCTMKDVLEQNIPLESVTKYDNTDWFKKLSDESDFYQRIRVFIEGFTQIENKKAASYGKKEIVQSVKQLVYASDGMIKMHDISDETGYSERYINKIFIEEMGFSPKHFCKIIQFQRALEFLNYGAPDKMTDAAVYLGYYDQSQFIRDFSKYAGVTPKKYLNMVERLNYRNKIVNTANSFDLNSEI